MSSVTLINAKLNNTEIHGDISHKSIGQLLEQGKIIILKHVFQTDTLNQLKQSIHQWGTKTPVFPAGQSASVENINFHRIDTSQTVSKLPHIFHQYGFGDLTNLPDDLAKQIEQIASPMMQLQNNLANTHYQLDMPQVRVKFLHYPCGGGYLDNHVHPLSPQKIGLITSLSEWGSDFFEGGNVFTTDSGKSYTSKDHQTGDILVFRYDIPHEIKPINPQDQLDWNAISGKWSLVLELLETNSLSSSI